MITSTQVDIGAMRETEKRIFEHIGRLTVLSAQIDQSLSSLLAWMTGAPDHDQTRKIFEGEQVNVKLRLLTRALPEEWPDKKRLKTAIGMIQDYRNRLAHSVVSSTISIPSGAVNFHMQREQKAGLPEAVDFDELQLWEARAEVLSIGLFTLSKIFLRDRSIMEADLRDLIFRFITNPSIEQQQAIDHVLPPVQGSEPRDP